jgi:hypothetical protein
MENAEGNLHSSCKGTEATEEKYENSLVLEQGLRAGIRSQDDPNAMLRFWTQHRAFC